MPSDSDKFYFNKKHEGLYVFFDDGSVAFYPGLSGQVNLDVPKKKAELLVHNHPGSDLWSQFLSFSDVLTAVDAGAPNVCVDTTGRGMIFIPNRRLLKTRNPLGITYSVAEEIVNKLWEVEHGDTNFCYLMEALFTSPYARNIAQQFGIGKFARIKTNVSDEKGYFVLTRRSVNKILSEAKKAEMKQGYVAVYPIAGGWSFVVATSMKNDDPKIDLLVLPHRHTTIKVRKYARNGKIYYVIDTPSGKVTYETTVTGDFNWRTKLVSALAETRTVDELRERMKKQQRRKRKPKPKKKTIEPFVEGAATAAALIILAAGASKFITG